MANTNNSKWVPKHQALPSCQTPSDNQRHIVLHYENQFDLFLCADNIKCSCSWVVLRPCNVLKRLTSLKSILFPGEKSKRFFLFWVWDALHHAENLAEIGKAQEQFWLVALPSTTNDLSGVWTLDLLHSSPVFYPVGQCIVVGTF